MTFLLDPRLSSGNPEAKAKLLKTLPQMYYRVVSFSRIRERRENLCWVLERRALHVVGLDPVDRRLIEVMLDFPD